MAVLTQIEYYVNGLDYNIKKEVLLPRPSSVTEAMIVAETINNIMTQFTPSRHTSYQGNQNVFDQQKINNIHILEDSVFQSGNDNH